MLDVRNATLVTAPADSYGLCSIHPFLTLFKHFNKPFLHFSAYFLFPAVENQNDGVHDASDCSDENEVGGADLESPCWQGRGDKERI